MGRRRYVGVAVALSLTLSGLLAGCGEDAPKASPVAAVEPEPVVTAGPDLFADVSARMVEVGTANFVFSGTGGGQPLSGSAAMTFLDDSYRADVRLTLPETGAVRAVLAPGPSYLALPAIKGLPKNKPWLKVAPEGTSAGARRLQPVVEQLRSTFDPALRVGLLRAAGRVRQLGPDTAEGVTTTRYRAEVEIDRIIAMHEGGAEEYVAMRKAGILTLRYDVWIDISGLPRRYRINFPSVDGVFSVTGVYRDWGMVDEVTVPAAASVLDASKLGAQKPAERAGGDRDGDGDGKKRKR